LVFVLTLSFAGLSYAAGDGGTHVDVGPSKDGGTTAGDAGDTIDGGVDPEPAVRELLTTTGRVRAFLRGELDTSVDPATLFDVPLDDEAAIAIEAKRLAAIVERAEAKTTDGADGGADAAPVKKAHKPGKPERTSSGDAGSPVDASADAEADADLQALETYDALRSTDPERWKARIGLDRARLAFYVLPTDERKALLAKQAERQKADTEAKAKRELTEVERKAKDAEEDQKRALEAAKNARSEAERVVAEEQARLLGVTRTQAEFEAKLVQNRAELQKRSEEALAWRRKVSETISAAGQDASSPDVVDAQYRNLRVTLRAARDQLDVAIAAWSSGDSEVPAAGPDALATLSVEVDRTEVQDMRARVSQNETRLRQEEYAFRQTQTRQLLDEIESLNRLRLSLLPHLSSATRKDVTGFDSAGRDQAGAETRQVGLVLRYHVQAAQDWFAGIRQGSNRGEFLLSALWLLLKWSVPVAAFIWWRRRADRALRELRSKVREKDKKRRTIGPSLIDRALSFTLRVRAPAEWLLLSWVAVWLLPGEGEKLLEVELLTTLLQWTFGGQLVVYAVDALASDKAHFQRSAASVSKTSSIRFRSLRLVGVTVVVFGLILELSDQLVGQGTIYQWVFSTCWFAAIPIALVLVKWWRPVIFERMERVRKKRALEMWIIGKKEGAASFLAAMVGGGYLLVTGTLRVVRGWVGTFNITRRLLAYWFRRGMDKKAEDAAGVEYEPVDPVKLHRMGPETPSPKNVPSEADAQVEDVINRIKMVGGGVFAIVGERGAGKSTLVKRIAARADELTMVSCPTEGLPAFTKLLNRELGRAEDEPIEAAARQLDGKEIDSALLIDDAHHLIKPMVGGLDEFDALLDLARHHSRNCTWIFAIDEVLWRLVERARGARPLFDDVIQLVPWSEEAIQGLLTNRNKIVDIEPSFEHLLDPRAAEGDELDRQDALTRTSASYYRLLWDYSTGNPGVALHFWRSSLGVAPDGKLYARRFDAPDASDLEDLPDEAVFVLRAIVQLDWALPEDISRATSLSASKVQDALRYGAMRGYFDQQDGRYRVTWNWYRAITRLLYRRHLIFSGS